MTEKITIDRNIPIPKISRGSRPSKYPWAEMEIGDSFVMNRKRPNGTVSAANKRYSCKFIARTVEGGVRVWRIA